MKIIIHKTQTSFYCEKTDFKKLRFELDKIKKLSHYLLIWIENRFILKHKITELQKEKITQWMTK